METVFDKGGPDAKLAPKMETRPKEIVGNVHAIPAARNVRSISEHLCKSYLSKGFKDAWMYGLKDLLVESIVSMRVVATSEQATRKPMANIWLDVRIGMAKPDCNIPKKLARMENGKLEAPNAWTLFDGMVSVIFEEYCCPGQCATIFLNRTLRRRVTRLEQSSHLTHRVAWMTTSRELPAPISCLLL